MEGKERGREDLFNQIKNTIGNNVVVIMKNRKKKIKRGLWKMVQHKIIIYKKLLKIVKISCTVAI